MACSFFRWAIADCLYFLKSGVNRGLRRLKATWQFLVVSFEEGSLVQVSPNIVVVSCLRNDRGQEEQTDYSTRREESANCTASNIALALLSGCIWGTIARALRPIHSNVPNKQGIRRAN